MLDASRYQQEFVVYDALLKELAAKAQPSATRQCRRGDSVLRRTDGEPPSVSPPQRPAVVAPRNTLTFSTATLTASYHSNAIKGCVGFIPP